MKQKEEIQQKHNKECLDKMNHLKISDSTNAPKPLDVPPTSQEQ
jgi:hypothetical protein